VTRLEKGGRFWAATVVTSHVELEWGDLGKPGQRQVRSFDSTETASQKLAELIAARVAEGYVEVRAGHVRPAEPAAWTRRFEGNGAFLELTLEGRRVQQRRGRLDTGAAEVSTVMHPSIAEAVDITTRIERRALASGLVLVHAGVPSPSFEQLTFVANTELEAMCREAPDDPGPWSVYADWLIAREDVRGELAAMLVNGAAEAAAELFAAHWLALFGNHAALADMVEITASRFGFPCGAVIQIPPDHPDQLDELTASFLALPIATFVDSLQLRRAGRHPDDEWSRALAAISGAPQARTLRELHLDGWSDTTTPAARLAELPALEVLHIRGRIHALNVPTLRKLVIVAGGTGTTEIEAFQRSTFPHLEHLDLALGPTVFGADELRPLLAGERVPKLRHLGLREVRFALVRALAGSPLLRRLRTLDLTSTTMASSALQMLHKHAAAFRHLDRIEVHESLPIEDLAGVLPNLAHARGTPAER
jgi:uncharacterized protein (TIGR02996 family)